MKLEITKFTETIKTLDTISKDLQRFDSKAAEMAKGSISNSIKRVTELYLEGLENIKPQEPVKS